MSDTAVKEQVNLAYAGYPQWYRELNARAREQEASINWPDARQEAWRRTDLKRVNLEALYLDGPAEPDPLPSGPRSFQIPQATDHHLRLAPLKDAVAGDFPGVRELLERQFNAAENRFMLRLLAEAPRGFYFYLPRNYKPSDILFLEDQLTQKGCGCGGECGCAGKNESFTLNLVVLEEGAQAEIWERISHGENKTSVHNRATLFLVQKDAHLKYFRTQTLHNDNRLFDFSRALLKEGAEFYSFQAEKEIQLNKSHMVAELQGSHAHAELRGIYHIREKFFSEIFTEQIHLAPKCVSHSLFRGVLEDKARTVFNGMIRVSPEAVNTDAYLTNNNLLMNDGCRADSIPGLRIATNEVKCSHGSTTGKVNPQQLFYLTSRGFSMEEARSILTRAFLEEVLDDLPQMVKTEIETHWDLGGEAS